MLLERAQVLKFGGTSVGGSEALRQSCAVIERHRREGNGVLVVVSAMAGVTDQLHLAYQKAIAGDLNVSHQLIDELTERHIQVTRDLIGSTHSSQVETNILTVTGNLKEMLRALSFLGEDTARVRDVIVPAGEMLSPYIVAACLDSMGLPVLAVDARNIVKTDDHFGDANANIKLTAQELEREALPELVKGKVVVIGGYHGTNKSGHLTTFGRGGSDKSATVLARVLEEFGVEVDGVYLYKADVGGVLSAEPKIVSNTHIVDHLTREEAAILAGLGGKVLHSKAIQVLRGTPIPIYCRSTIHSDEPGTTIDDRVIPDDTPVKVVTSQWPFTMIDVAGMGMDQPNIASRIFQMLGEADIDVRAIMQPMSEHQLRVVVPSNVDKVLLQRDLRVQLQSLLDNQDISVVEVGGGISAVGIIGPGAGKQDAMGKITNAIYHNGGSNSGERVINISTGNSLCSVLFQNDADGIHAKTATQLIHKELFDS